MSLIRFCLSLIHFIQTEIVFFYFQNFRINAISVSYCDPATAVAKPQTARLNDRTLQYINNMSGGCTHTHTHTHTPEPL